MTVFKPGDRVHHAPLLRTGTIRSILGHTLAFIDWDEHLASYASTTHLEPAGEPMSKRTDFLDADGSPMTIEGRADHENWAMKFRDSYREFTPANAPALALAILEAAGWPGDYPGGVSNQIVADLRRVVEITEQKAKEAAEQKALDADALALCLASAGLPAGNGWPPVAPKDLWINIAKVARKHYGVTK